MSTNFPESNQLIGDDITEGDFKVAIDQFLTATIERVGDSGDVGASISALNASISGLSNSKQDALTPGYGIDIKDNVISSTVTQVVAPYAVGAYALAYHPGYPGTLTVGTTVPGSTLIFGTYLNGFNVQIPFNLNQGEHASGTWQAMNKSIESADDYDHYCLWQRIA